MKKMMRTNPMSKALRSESVQAKKKTAAVSFKAMALVLAIAFAVSSLSAVLVSSLVGSHRRDRVSAAAATTRVLPEVNSANSVSNENYASKGKEIPIFNCTHTAAALTTRRSTAATTPTATFTASRQRACTRARRT